MYHTHVHCINQALVADLDIFQCGRRVTFYVMSFHDNTNVTNLPVKYNSGLSYTIGT